MFTKEESVIKSILLIHKEIFTARYYIPSWFYKNQLGFFMPKFPYITIPRKGVAIKFSGKGGRLICTNRVQKLNAK